MILKKTNLSINRFGPDKSQAKINFLHLPVKIAGKDIKLNVSFNNALIRFGITLFLPMIMLLIDWHLIIYTAPVMAYLFVSAITHFCIFK